MVLARFRNGELLSLDSLDSEPAEKERKREREREVYKIVSITFD